MKRSMVTLTFGLLAALYSAAQSPAFNQEIFDRAMKAIAPQQTLVFRAPAEVIEEALTPADLVGFDIMQNGEAVTGAPLTLSAANEIELILYWRIVWRPEGIMKYRIEIADSGPKVTKDLAVQTKAWQPGGVYKTRIILPMRPLAYSGTGAFRVVQVGAEKAPVLCDVPVMVNPILTESSLEADTVKLGDKAQWLGVAFRLGPNATLTIPCAGVSVPEGMGPIPTRIGVISSVAYEPHLAEGEAVAVVQIVANGVNQCTREVKAGEDTAITDWDYFDPENLTHKKAEVYGSTSASYPNAAGESFEKHQYIGWLPIEAETTPTELIFTYARSKGVLDVKGLVLDFAQDVPAPEGAEGAPAE